MAVAGMLSGTAFAEEAWVRFSEDGQRIV